jgi:hypothetical protein
MRLRRRKRPRSARKTRKPCASQVIELIRGTPLILLNQEPTQPETTGAERNDETSQDDFVCGR